MNLTTQPLSLQNAVNAMNDQNNTVFKPCLVTFCYVSLVCFMLYKIVVEMAESLGWLNLHGVCHES